jgi:hypothetical protein
VSGPATNDQRRTTNEKAGNREQGIEKRRGQLKSSIQNPTLNTQHPTPNTLLPTPCLTRSRD